MLASLRGTGSVVALVCALAACSDETPPVDEIDAFPSRRPQLSGTGSTLGFVANRLSDTVSVIDLDAMSVLATVPVGRDPVEIDGPRQLLLDPDAGLAYVLLSYPLTVESPHVATEGGGLREGYVQALSLSDLTLQGEQRLQYKSFESALSPDRGELAISHYDTVRSLQGASLEARRATIAFVAPPSSLVGNAAAMRSLTLCVTPAALAYGKDRSRLFVACTGEDSLFVVDTTPPAAAITSIKSGAFNANQPFALVPDPTRERLALSNQVAGTVVIFSMQDQPEVLATTNLVGVPAFAGWLSSSEFIVPTRDPSGAARVDAITGEILAQTQYPIADCERASEVTLLPDGRLMLVCQGTSYEPGSLVQINRETLEIETVVELGLEPARLAVLAP
jgi:YVTN family beta-propeller protein